MEDHIFSLFTEFFQPLMKNTLNLGKLKLKRYLAALFMGANYYFNVDLKD
ncbi:MULTISPECIES: hypothetical protein [Sphingobacterium]|nr:MULTISPECIES: hypothetical protein [Sphingobacterium]